MKRILILLSLLTAFIIAPSCKKDKKSEPAPTPTTTPTAANPIVSFKFYNVDGIQTYSLNNLSYRLMKYTVEAIPTTMVSSSLTVYQCNSAASSSPYECTDLDSTFVTTPSTSACEACSTTLVAGTNMVMSFDLYNNGTLVSSYPINYDGSSLGSSHYCVKSVGSTSNPKYDVYIRIQ